MRAAIGAVALLAFLVLLLVFIRVQRRQPKAPDPCEWRQGVAEPWGSIALVVFLLWPALGTLLGNRLLGFAILAAIGLIVAIVLSRGIRRFAVKDDRVEWRTMWGRESSSLEDVVAVSDPDDLDIAPEVLLSSGRIIRLPDSPHVRLVMTTLARARSTMPSGE